MAVLQGNEISVTQTARSYLADLAASEAGTRGLRLSIKEGKGCGGNEYDLQFVQTPDLAADDALPLSETLTLFVPKKDMLKLFGMKIDYVTDDLGNSRLDLSNPNEKGRCGCGASVTF